jgi:hypothetical protein
MEEITMLMEFTVLFHHHVDILLPNGKEHFVQRVRHDRRRHLLLLRLDLARSEGQRAPSRAHCSFRRKAIRVGSPSAFGVTVLALCNKGEADSTVSAGVEVMVAEAIHLHIQRRGTKALAMLRNVTLGGKEGRRG